MRCGTTSENSCQPTALFCKGPVNFTSTIEIIEHYWRCHSGDATISFSQEQISLEHTVIAVARSSSMQVHQLPVQSYAKSKFVLEVIKGTSSTENSKIKCQTRYKLLAF